MIKLPALFSLRDQAVEYVTMTIPGQMVLEIAVPFTNSPTERTDYATRISLELESMYGLDTLVKAEYRTMLLAYAPKVRIGLGPYREAIKEEDITDIFIIDERVVARSIVLAEADKTITDKMGHLPKEELFPSWLSVTSQRPA